MFFDALTYQGLKIRKEIDMSNYVIMTDSSCDLTLEMIKELGIKSIQLDVVVDGAEPMQNDQIDAKVFYGQLRDGKMATTSAVGIDRFISAMEEILLEGKDLIYIGFSSGLSGTYNAGFVAASELSEKYPERKVYTVDTLAASMGEGLLVYYAAKMQQSGADIEAVRDYIENNKLNLCHWFTVNDLFFLKRGGRVSATTAVVGSMLNIKPVMHVDNAGKLINVAKARGRKAAIEALFNKMKETAIEPQTQTVFISHGDCIEDAEYLADKIKKEFGIKDIEISYVGPVIGAHSGPGTLALFFLGTNR